MICCWFVIMYINYLLLFYKDNIALMVEFTKTLTVGTFSVGTPKTKRPVFQVVIESLKIKFLIEIHRKFNFLLKMYSILTSIISLAWYAVRCTCVYILIQFHTFICFYSYQQPNVTFPVSTDAENESEYFQTF